MNWWFQSGSKVVSFWSPKKCLALEIPLQQAKDQVKHWTKKAAEKSEEHARVNQR